MGYSKQVFTYLRAYELEREIETQKKQDEKIIRSPKKDRKPIKAK